jgi:hypothetical protein
MERMAVATKPMQMTTSPMTLHSAASPGDMRVASDVAPPETEGVAKLAIVPVVLGDVVLDCVSAVVTVGGVPIIECVVPIAVIDVVFEGFVSLVAIPPNV